MKKIQLFNGRCCNKLSLNGKLYQHAYVGAFSEKHAVELLQQAGYLSMTIGTLRKYWCKGLWGSSMQNIEPQIGVWAIPKILSKPEDVVRLK